MLGCQAPCYFMYLVMGLYYPWMQTWVQIIDTVEEDTEAQKNNSPRVPKLIIKIRTGPMYCLGAQIFIHRSSCSGYGKGSLLRR